MGENAQLRRKCAAYVDGEVPEHEFVGWLIEHLAWNYAVAFWCHVMRLKSQHDHVGDRVTIDRIDEVER